MEGVGITAPSRQHVLRKIVFYILDVIVPNLARVTEYVIPQLFPLLSQRLKRHHRVALPPHYFFSCWCFRCYRYFLLMQWIPRKRIFMPNCTWGRHPWLWGRERGGGGKKGVLHGAEKEKGTKPQGGGGGVCQFNIRSRVWWRRQIKTKRV